MPQYRFFTFTLGCILLASQSGCGTGLLRRRVAAAPVQKAELAPLVIEVVKLDTPFATQDKMPVEVGVEAMVSRPMEPSEHVTISIKLNEKVIERWESNEKRSQMSPSHSFTLRETGTYRIECTTGGGDTHVAFVTVTNALSFGGRRAIQARQSLPAGIIGNEDSPKLAVSVWTPYEEERAYLAEWKKDGVAVEGAPAKRMKIGGNKLAARLYVQGDPEKPPVGAWVYERVEVEAPARFAKEPGQWEVTFHMEGAPSRRFLVERKADGRLTGATEMHLIPLASRTTSYNVSVQALLTGSEVAVSPEARAKLDAVPREALGDDRTPQEFRARVRNEEARLLRERLDARGPTSDYKREYVTHRPGETAQEMHRRQEALDRASNAYATKRMGEADKRRAALKALVEKYGGPWTEAEIGTAP